MGSTWEWGQWPPKKGLTMTTPQMSKATIVAQEFIVALKDIRHKFSGKVAAAATNRSGNSFWFAKHDTE